MKKLLTLIAAMIMCDAYGETVNWFVDGALIDQTSCTSSDNITKPDTPEKNGNRFIGWTIYTEKEAAMTKLVSLLDTNSKSFSPSNSSTRTTWSATWADGTVVYGETKCSSTGSSSLCLNDTNPCTTSINAPATSGDYCWCKMNSIKIDGETTNISLAWVYYNNPGDQPGGCDNNCARNCGYGAGNFPKFRRWLFGLQ